MLPHYLLFSELMSQTHSQKSSSSEEEEEEDMSVSEKETEDICPLFLIPGELPKQFGKSKALKLTGALV